MVNFGASIANYDDGQVARWMIKILLGEPVVNRRRDANFPVPAIGCSYFANKEDYERIDVTPFEGNKKSPILMRSLSKN